MTISLADQQTIAPGEYRQGLSFIVDKEICRLYVAAMTKPIHPLRRWLFERQETLSDFAARIGTSQGYVSEWLTGKKVPNADLMASVSTATKGAVTPNDFVAFYTERNRSSRKRPAA